MLNFQLACRTHCSLSHPVLILCSRLWHSRRHYRTIHWRCAEKE